MKRKNNLPAESNYTTQPVAIYNNWVHILYDATTATTIVVFYSSTNANTDNKMEGNLIDAAGGHRLVGSD